MNFSLDLYIEGFQTVVFLDIRAYCVSVLNWASIYCSIWFSPSWQIVIAFVATMWKFADHEGMEYLFLVAKFSRIIVQ